MIRKYKRRGKDPSQKFLRKMLKTNFESNICGVNIIAMALGVEVNDLYRKEEGEERKYV